MAFAGAYPECVQALALYAVYAKREWAPDYPWAPTREARQVFYDKIQNGWGGPVGVEDIAPNYTGDEAFCNWWATYQRRSASPAAALALARMNVLIDVRDVLPLIRAPTLVMHRTGDRDSHVDEGRYIASRIPRAAFEELPGDDHLVYAGDVDDIVARVRAFVERATGRERR
jgi:pimeloyl-ACP methyl ester carboxylesterase